MRVLLVEDEASLRMTLAANLELEGLEVIEAEHAEAALARIGREQFDIVLSDVRMPGMSGVAMYQKIKALVPGLPVILMTAFALEEQLAEAIRDGVYTVVPKPFGVEQIVKTLARASQRPVVVVVDGEEADTTVGGLARAGLRARAIHRPEEAAEAVRSGTVDVCIVDLAAEGASDLIERIVSLDLGVSIIAMSAQIEPAVMARIASVVHVFLHKPVSANDLLEVVAHARREAAAS